jgi:two-component system, chemotaxis family, response regulator Rcp1
MSGSVEKQINILLVEDNPGDIMLTQELFKEAKIDNEIHVVNDGVQAMEYLHQQIANRNGVPDLILLDLNLPRLDGRQFLKLLRMEEGLRSIPVAVLTSSAADEDVLMSYNLDADCFVAKPIDVYQIMKIIERINGFGISVVRVKKAMS